MNVLSYTEIFVVRSEDFHENGFNPAIKKQYWPTA